MKHGFDINQVKKNEDSLFNVIAPQTDLICVGLKLRQKQQNENFNTIIKAG